MGKRNYDKELHAATQFIWHKQPAAQAGGRVSKIIYLRAAKLIWDKHSDIHLPQMSEHLTVLAEKLNAKYGTALKSLGATTIAGFLKAKSPHEAGAPHKDKDASTPHNIEWDYVIGNM